MCDQYEDVLSRFWSGDVVALAKLISAVEDRRDGYECILTKLFPKSGGAYRVGVTGPPGAGKSTIVDKLTLALAGSGSRVGIVAVDPTSPFTGGALLGDRVRMRDLAVLDNVFIRSMATRGSLGGLAQATKDVLVVLDAFGKDYILVETVGVGQVELDVVDACDTVVVVLTPEAGDSVQAMKAGLVEIADIFVVNKADRQGADIFIYELQSMLEIKEEFERGGEGPRWKVPIVPTVATKSEGIEELLEKIQSHRRFLRESGFWERKRKLQIEHKVRQLLEEHVRGIVERDILSRVDVDEIVGAIYDGRTDPYTAAKMLLSKARLEGYGEADKDTSG